MDIKVNISPIPEQDLEGKIAYVSRITSLYATGEDGHSVSKPLGQAPRVGVEVRHLSSDQYGIQTITYDQDEFKKFQSAYGLKFSQDLIGRSVISICDVTSCITGLIPLITGR